MFGWCAYNRLLHPPAAGAGAADKKSFGSVRLSPALVSTFKYGKKGVDSVNAEEEEEVCERDDECVVCLNGFEDDEDVRQLPRCKHCFHAACIDMWLCSHSKCPLCRTPVDSMSKQKAAMAAPKESSQEVVVAIDIM
ncbi:hypothetical protein FH972_003542 [Carpinus fangiana]|uniref:RING-type E3 ubiquitin transferase n=1 Tax=Carpinus fangiana TaxID=176857 RepID=A0A5N6QLP0_9ROSI|nr:hypothetical protein FH972_003542 [Carpinus fangiana]